MRGHDDLLDEIRHRIAAHARPDLSTPIDGLLMSKVTTASAAPEYSLTEPLVVVMAQGGKRLLLGDEVHEYRAGQCLVVTANLPVTGHYIDIAPGCTFAGHGAGAAPGRRRRTGAAGPGGAIVARRDTLRSRRGRRVRELLDAVARLLRLLDGPSTRPCWRR